MTTFKEIQDSVLEWCADQDNDGLLLTLVKDAINTTQVEILTAEMFDFMLWPKNETINVVSGTTKYRLHPLYFQGLWFYNPTTDEYLEEVGAKQLLESGANWNDATQGEPDRFQLTSLTNVLNQPTAAGAVTVTPTGGNEAAANSVVVRGIADGEYREETLSSGSSWASLTGALNFDHILQVIKVGATWTRTITVTVGATTIVSFRSDQQNSQYRQLELLATPDTSATIQYRFYRQARWMEYDNEMPDVPMAFVQLLKLGTLLKLQGYTRATGSELKLWQEQYDSLLKNMQQTYQHGRTLGARSNSVRYIPRTP